jgi:hypothetical protein
MVADLIVTMSDLDEPDFNVIWDYDLPDEAAAALWQGSRGAGRPRRYLTTEAADRDRNGVAAGLVGSGVIFGVPVF